MLNPKIRTTLAAALCAGVLFAAAPFASAGHDTPPPPDGHGEHNGRPHGEGHGPGRGHGHGHRGGGPFLQALKSLDLSDAQRDSIRNAMKASWQSGRLDAEARHALHRQLLTTPPTAANYRTLVSQVADSEADAARDRVQRMARLKAEVYGMLTDTQRAQLEARLKALPEPGPRSEHGRRLR